MNKYKYAILFLLEILHEIELADKKRLSICEYKKTMTKDDSDSIEDLERVLDKFGVLLDRLRDNTHKLN